MGNWTKNHKNEHQQRNACGVLGRMEENYLTIPTKMQEDRRTAKKARAQYFEAGLPGLRYKTMRQCPFKPIQRSVRLVQI